MNHHEIEACVIRAKRGDKEAIILILEQFKPFIYRTGREFNIKGNDMYDISQTGYVALINAIEKYKIGSHTFSSYAYTSIKNSIRYLARSNNKYNSDLSTNEKIGSDYDSYSEFIDSIESDTDIEKEFFKNCDLKLLKTIVAMLSPEDFELIYFHYFNNISLKSYAEKKGLNYISVVRKKDKILSFLKDEYNKR